ncbi:uncharacterized protein Bfra_002002 [Botrytis fragariae]|uniref:Uncharacterized protein n=1 Tax=Botrytis fragariae TaxID=1964551 RepID=A0A8H6EMT7_9HELO|nr:uncharacterized protein Bfra_002002 [Botrytis fragariae]KAF5877635.1 hypothetical protein Bfra_002002 [Botrytis fragariae]
MKPFLNPSGTNNNWWLFSAHFVNSINDYGVSDTTAIQGYLLNPGDPLSSSMGINGVHFKPPIVTNDVYAERLGQLMNTYWACANLSDENVVRVNSSSADVVRSGSIEVINATSAG